MLLSFCTIPVTRMLADDYPGLRMRLLDASVLIPFCGRFIFCDNICILLFIYLYEAY